jgi:hypothetical protein
VGFFCVFAVCVYLGLGSHGCLLLKWIFGMRMRATAMRSISVWGGLGASNGEGLCRLLKRIGR